MNSKSGVLVVDFGAQYAQLIARRVREAKVYSEIVPSHITAAEVTAKNPAAIILSGGPASVYSEGAPKFDSEILKLGIPVFGICYGFQVMAAALGGVVSQTGKSEFGRTEIKVESVSKIFSTLPALQSVWMSHGDAVTQAPAGFAICAVVLGDPWQSRDAGFALSVLATAGLLLLAPRIVEKLPTHKKLAEALAPPIAAIVFCSPILVSLSGYLSPMSIVANLLAAPAVAIITVLGFIAALVSPFAPWLTQFIIFFIRFPAGFITGIAHWVAAFPVLTIHNGLIGFGLVALILVVFILFKRSWKQSTAVLLIVIFTLGWLQRWPAGDWQVAQCDVGQGDSLVVNLGADRAIVIDVGPEPVAEDKCLKNLGIKEIPLLILSHFHADHVGGLSGLLKGRKVNQVWISNNLEPELHSKLALNSLKSSQIVRVQKGLTAQVGEVRLKVLWPEATTRTFEELPGEGSAINNSSIAVIAQSSDWSLFSAGDLEPPAQHELINLVGPVDIYKLCHHGSKYQDEGLMKALSAQIALISVGAKNPYGHPAKESIDSLTRLGTQVFRTDTDGAIAVTASAHHLRVRKSKGRIKLFYWS